MKADYKDVELRTVWDFTNDEVLLRFVSKQNPEFNFSICIGKKEKDGHDITDVKKWAEQLIRKISVTLLNMGLKESHCCDLHCSQCNEDDEEDAEDLV